MKYAGLQLAPFRDVPYTGERFCAVFAARVLAAHGLPWPNVDRPEQAADWQKVPHARALDVIVFLAAGKPAHVGVCVGHDEFIHVEAGCRSRIESLVSPLWRSRIEGIYRYTA